MKPCAIKYSIPLSFHRVLFISAVHQHLTVYKEKKKVFHYHILTGKMIAGTREKVTCWRSFSRHKAELGIDDKSHEFPSNVLAIR